MIWYLVGIVLLPDTFARSVTPSTCAGDSLRSPSWDVIDFQYALVDESTGVESVHIRIRNTAIHYTVLCFKQADLEACFWVQDDDGRSGPDDRIETYFEFDSLSRRLDLNQTWTCDEANPADK
jgi:hypothetical protein